jgi:hypothetical protein
MSEQSSKKGLSRRGFLKGTAGVGGGLVIASFAASFGLTDTASASHDHKDDIATILTLGCTAETLAATSYYNTIKGNPFGLSKGQLEYFKLALSSEIYHLNIWESLGGKSLASKFYVPEKFLADFAVNTATFIAAETAFTGAYLAATRRLAELGEPRLAATAAQFAATEAEHLALSRLAGGFIPNPNGLPAPIYYNVSDAAPTLAPFLQGAKGFIGPVEYPGIDAINALLGNSKSVNVPTFTMVF